MVKKAMNGWRLQRNGCEFTVVPDEICSLPTTLRADLRRDASPLVAVLMEENGGSLTDGTTKEARIMSTWRPVAGETRRRLKICHKSGQEAQDSESLGELKVRIENTGRPVAATSNKCSQWKRTTSCRM